MTATMSRTKTVMMEMVITRFVAILQSCQSPMSVGAPVEPGSALPTCHPPQRLDAPVHVSLAIEKRVVRVLNHLPLSV